MGGFIAYENLPIVEVETRILDAQNILAGPGADVVDNIIYLETFTKGAPVRALKAVFATSA